MAEIVRAVTGWSFTAHEAVRMGKRVASPGRVFNQRERITSSLRRAGWKPGAHGSGQRAYVSQNTVRSVFQPFSCAVAGGHAPGRMAPGAAGGRDAALRNNKPPP